MLQKSVNYRFQNKVHYWLEILVLLGAPQISQVHRQLLLLLKRVGVKLLVMPLSVEHFLYCSAKEQVLQLVAV